LYAFVVLGISFIGFIFSSLIKSSDIFIKIALYIFIYCLIISMAVGVLGFGGIHCLAKANLLLKVVSQSIRYSTKKSDIKTVDSTAKAITSDSPLIRKIVDPIIKKASTKVITDSNAQHKPEIINNVIAANPF
jgi:hypothetical protein